MQIITVEIIEEKAMKLLEGMEVLQLIRLRKEKVKEDSWENPIAKLKGAMTPQPLLEIDKQLDELRDAWE